MVLVAIRRLLAGETFIAIWFLGAPEDARSTISFRTELGRRRRRDCLVRADVDLGYTLAMAALVYLETSVISYLTAWPSRGYEAPILCTPDELMGEESSHVDAS